MNFWNESVVFAIGVNFVKFIKNMLIFKKNIEDLLIADFVWITNR
ncbi:hypothetical protein FEM08_08000 [Flavobacterium gilvum]|nr:hypothetical protein FEM08_08000 [Flavobacterium gilvum]